MTTTVFQIRCCEADEAPVSYGFYTTLDAARRELRVHVDAPGNQAFTWIQAGGDPDVLGNEFQNAFACALDEIYETPDRVDAGQVVDFTNTVSDEGDTLGVWWIEAHDVKD